MPSSPGVFPVFIDLMAAKISSNVGGFAYLPGLGIDLLTQMLLLVCVCACVRACARAYVRMRVIQNELA